MNMASESTMIYEKVDVSVTYRICLGFILMVLFSWFFAPVSTYLNCFKILPVSSNLVTISVNEAMQQTVKDLKETINLPADLIEIIVYNYMFGDTERMEICNKMNAQIKYKSAILCLFMGVDIIIGILLYIAGLVATLHVSKICLWTDDEYICWLPSALWFSTHLFSIFFWSCILGAVESAMVYSADIQRYSPYILNIMKDMNRDPSCLIWLLLCIWANIIILVLAIVEHFIGSFLWRNVGMIMMMLLVTLGPTYTILCYNRLKNVSS